MSDFTLAPCSSMRCGMTGSGKTTHALATLKETPAVCRFIFDDRGLMAKRLKVKPCFDAEDLEGALATGFVAFYPHQMFPPSMTDKKLRADQKAFRFFCEWAYYASRRGPGKKFFVTDELWQYCTRNVIPWQLDAISRMGREENLELMVCTQTPRLTPENIIGQLTDVYAFKLDAALDLDFMAKNFPIPVAEIKNLDMGEYIHWNKLSNKISRGASF